MYAPLIMNFGSYYYLLFYGIFFLLFHVGV